MKHYNKSDVSKKKKKIVYEHDTIKFKSKLELYCYKLFASNDIQIEYEPETICFIDDSKFSFNCYEANEHGKFINNKKLNHIQFVPDFVVTFNDTKYYIEVKGFVKSEFPLKWKLFKQHLKDNNFKGDIFLPTNQKEIDKTFEIITSYQ